MIGSDGEIINHAITTRKSDTSPDFEINVNVGAPFAGAFLSKLILNQSVQKIRYILVVTTSVVLGCGETTEVVTTG